jgi:tetratricopeptide (TPR) repeat protein
MLLAVALLSACGAGGSAVSPPATAAETAAASHSGPFGAYLAGRFAQSEADTRTAADRLLEALQRDPDQAEVVTRAFVAALLDGRADAVRLARRLPDNQAAALLLIGTEAQAGRWDRAEQRIRALPRQGPAALLGPLLLAWTLQGKGQTDQAIAVLRPLAESGRLRGMHALHLAMVADVAGRGREAERYARMALAETPDASLRMLQVAGGILARNGGEADATRMMEALGRGNGDFAIAARTPEARRALLAGGSVASPTEGMAEGHIALAAALRGQRGGEVGLMLTRLAGRLRPDFAPTTLLLADYFADENHPQAALAQLDTIPASDPLWRVAALRRAEMLDRLDRIAEAEAALRQVAQADPAAPQPMLRLGEMLRKRNRFADAVAAYDAAIERIGTPDADDWVVFYARGISNERAGPTSRRRSSWRRNSLMSSTTSPIPGWRREPTLSRRGGCWNARSSSVRTTATSWTASAGRCSSSATSLARCAGWNARWSSNPATA